MLRITLLCVGRMKEKYFAEALREYEKRLQRYCSLELIELQERGSPIKEGAELLAHIPAGAYVAALCVEGRALSSTQLASLLDEKSLSGISRLCFIVGGSEGLSDAVKDRADLRLSMSEMTFPHHLARIMLAEQIYRAFTILGGSKYHK
jgi:23S rRNA (pseudouridine1915-N3)-methyltransferase